MYNVRDEFKTDNKTERPLRVTIISHSDMLGSAGLSMMRLMKALQFYGHEVTMLVFTKVSELERVKVVGGNTSQRLMAFGLERLKIWLNNGFSRKNLFKVSIANLGIDVATHPDVTGADVLILGWINQGLMSFDGLNRLAELKKPTLWVMHDLWAMTGCCHHPRECRRFEGYCGNCHLLNHGRKELDMSRDVWWKKNALFSRANYHFVAVSRFVAKMAQSSMLLKDKEVTVIPSTFPPGIFKPDRGKLNLYALPRDKHIIVFCEKHIDDPLNGLPLAIEAFNHLFDTDPMLTNNSEVVFVGELQNPAALNDLRFSYRHIGSVHEAGAMADILANADVLVSTAHYETFGLSLLEAMACGATPVAFDRGGHDDIITHKENGYLAKYRDAIDVAEGIKWAIDANLDRDAQYVSAIERFSPDVVAGRFDALLQRIVDEGKSETPYDADVAIDK